jgi:hypothetical protein
MTHSGQGRNAEVSGTMSDTSLQGWARRQALYWGISVAVDLGLIVLFVILLRGPFSVSTSLYDWAGTLSGWLVFLILSAIVGITWTVVTAAVWAFSWLGDRS